MIDRVELRSDGLRSSFKLPVVPTEAIDGESIASLALTGFIPMQMKRRSPETAILLEGISELVRQASSPGEAEGGRVCAADGLAICLRVE